MFFWHVHYNLTTFNPLALRKAIRRNRWLLAGLSVFPLWPSLQRNDYLLTARFLERVDVTRSCNETTRRFE